MKITIGTFILGIIFYGVLNTASAYEKATIYFKNGEQLDCVVEKYDPGKWADIIEPSGVKRTLNWDVINVIYFKKEEATQEEIKQSAENVVVENPAPVVPPPAVETVPVSDVPKTDAVPMNLAQRLAQKEREKKEQEALAAKKSSEVIPTPAATASNVKPAQPPVQKPVQVIPRTEEVKGEKATLIYANGDKLDCIIEQYELGKWAVVVDGTGTKRIISWDTIKEIIFVKDETAPVVSAVTPPAASSASEGNGSGSMLDTFKNKPAQAEPEKPVNVKEEAYKQEIREENKYQQKPEIGYDKDSGKMGISYNKTLESDAKRRAWIEDGGMLKGYGFTVNYSYTSISEEFMKNMMKEAIGNDMPYEMSISTDGTTMHGFGMSYSGTLKWIKPPSYAEGRNWWGAFSIGGAGSFNLTIGKSDMTITMYDVPYYGTYTTESKSNMTITTLEFSGNVGYTLGLGKYFFSDSWKGVMLGLYWKPNFTMMSGTSESHGEYTNIDPQSNFNMSGFQWTVDFGSFGSLADRIANEAHFSINGYIIPETDVTPFMFSIGVGLLYY